MTINSDNQNTAIRISAEITTDNEGSASASKAGIKDVTANVVLLGQPFTKGPYARNVWDMQVFNDRIYLGHGNCNNRGPSPSAGPIPVIYYDTTLNKFVTQYTVNEDQIDLYKVINGNLYIPGYDSRESWEYGNYYVMANNTWQKYRTIPKASHVSDMAYYKGFLYAATSTEGFSPIIKQVNTATSWCWVSQMPTTGDTFYPMSNMVNTLFEFRDKLYAVSMMFYLNTFKENTILVMDGTNSVTQKIYGNKMIPGSSATYMYRMLRPTIFNDNIVYLGVKLANDIQWAPESMYIAPDINQAQRVVLPVPTSLPSDILLRNNTLYVLAYVKASDSSYTNIVYQTTDLKTWSELFRFTSDTFARSFEELNGDFYFGLGCNHNETLPSSTGNILKVSKAAYN